MGRGGRGAAGGLATGSLTRPQGGGGAGGSFLSPLAHVPWWGWLLIGLHLAYRISKVSVVRLLVEVWGLLLIGLHLAYRISKMGAA